MFYQVFHVYDVDGGFGDAVKKEKCVGVTEATQEEIKKFLETWDKPRIYEHPYSDLYEHHVVVRPVEVKPLADIEPYDPSTRDWPDLPDGEYPWCVWTRSEWVDDDNAEWNKVD
jgi:hypothetical protein